MHQYDWSPFFVIWQILMLYFGWLRIAIFFYLEHPILLPPFFLFYFCKGEVNSEGILHFAPSSKNRSESVLLNFFKLGWKGEIHFASWGWDQIENTFWDYPTFTLVDNTISEPFLSINIWKYSQKKKDENLVYR